MSSESNNELIKQARSNAKARYDDLNSEYVQMLKSKAPEAQDLWIIALNLVDALEAAQESLQVRKDDYHDLLQKHLDLVEQARADEEAMRYVADALWEWDLYVAIQLSKRLQERLSAHQAHQAHQARRGPAVSMWMGKPTRWWDNPTWRCPNGHVSKVYLKSEELGDVCLACYEPIELTFPEDIEKLAKPECACSERGPCAYHQEIQPGARSDD